MVIRTARRWLPLLPATLFLLAAAVLLSLVIGAWIGPPSATAAPADKRLDPAAWGGDHVGQSVPQYMESGECLFCHRVQLGVSWHKNKHNLTIREAGPEEPALSALRADAATKGLAGEVQLILGDNRVQRFLKRAQAYGKLDMLTAQATLGRTRRAKIEGAAKARWDSDVFALECAGCHATAVDPETHAFAMASIDCFSCHGDAPDDHANDAKLMPLAKARQDSPAVVTSICASCHVRFGKSKSTGLPYPTNFVAGDNLFKDFQVDFSVLDDGKLNPADAHVMDNIRDVVVYGRETVTCLSCHDVHNGTSKKHRELPVAKSCQHCHDAGDPIKGHKEYEVHSARCQY